MRLPASQLTLPGGFVIQVVTRSGAKMRALAKTDVDGYWQRGAHNGGVITLNRDSPEWTRVRTFGHELVHAVHDYALWLDQRADGIKAEAEETARELEEE